MLVLSAAFVTCNVEESHLFELLTSKMDHRDAARAGMAGWFASGVAVRSIAGRCAHMLPFPIKRVMSL